MSIAVRRRRFFSETMIVFLQSCNRCIDFCTALSVTELMEPEDLCPPGRCTGMDLESITEGGVLGLSALCASSAAAISCDGVSWDTGVRRT